MEWEIPNHDKKKDNVLVEGLKGKVVIITGGAGGIGTATASRFAREGFMMQILASKTGTPAGTRTRASGLGNWRKYLPKAKHLFC